ncbi:MAG TPA: aminotransferase class I/II-fold pyridoxal phosphate-dependent enzyme [Chloroflexota bacterium]|nr:aminotransferase class I/II-fold pyridoxal phosphate-dependent enzyme [Chloroflexota bacterium]
MRPLTSSIVNRVRPSGIRKFFDVPPDVISLGIGEPDFVTPRAVRAAAIDSIERGLTHYTSNYGLLELRQRISRDLEQRYGVHYDPETEILVTVGASEAIDVGVRAIVEHGDGVLLPEPGYVSYAACVAFAGAVIQPVLTYARNNFGLAAADVAKAITPATRAIVLGFPNNPTGAVLDPREAQRIVDLAVEHDLLIISDEIYHRLIYGDPHVCIPALKGARERTILVNGFSKGYAMTGWRLGYACAPAEIIEAMMKIHQYVIMSTPTAAQWAGIEALDHGEPDVQRMVAEYDRRRRRLVAGLNEMGLACVEPRGAFYAFPSIASTGLSSDEFSTRLLEEAKVAVIPGSAFGDQGEGYVRLCYATAYAEIEEALARIRRFLERLPTAPPALALAAQHRKLG